MPLEANEHACQMSSVALIVGALLQSNDQFRSIMPVRLSAYDYRTPHFGHYGLAITTQVGHQGILPLDLSVYGCQTNKDGRIKTRKGKKAYLIAQERRHLHPDAEVTRPIFEKFKCSPVLRCADLILWRGIEQDPDQDLNPPNFPRLGNYGSSAPGEIRTDDHIL